MKTNNVDQHIGRLVERDLSLERCQYYVTHLRALLYMQDSVEEDETVAVIAEGWRAESMSFLLDALENELHLSTSLCQGATQAA